MNGQPTNAPADLDSGTGGGREQVAAPGRAGAEPEAREIDESLRIATSELQPTGARTGGDERAPKMRWNVVDAAAIAFFLAVAYRITSSMWVSPTSLTPRANGTDQTFFEYMLLHGVRIFTHGENPFLTTQLNAPIGVNVMANTGLLGLSIPLAPLTAWLGPAAVYVLIIMLGMAGTATSWYYVLSRHIVGNRFAALIGGLICGFGPGIVTHSNGHPNLCAQFMLPLILWRALAMRNSTRWLRDGAILGGMIAYQALINEELLFLTALAGAVFVLLYIPFRPSAVRPAILPMGKGLGVAAAVSALILAYPIWYQFNGRAHFAGLPSWMQDRYRLTLASFVHTPSQSITGAPEVNQWLATRTEENSFLGWGLLITAAIAVIISAAISWRRNRWVIPLAFVGVLFAWASLGNMVYVTSGPKGPQHELPVSLWAHVNTLPIFESVLPSRLALVVLPVVGILIAVLVAEVCRAMATAIKREQAGRLLAEAVAIVAIMMAVVTVFPKSVEVAQRGSVPQFFTSGDYRRYIPAGTTVMPGDPSDTIGSMRWAVASDLHFGVPGGYFLGPDPKGKGQYGPQYRQTMVLLWDVAKGTWSLTSDVDYWKAVAAADLKYWNSSAIVLPVGAENFATLRSTITKLVGAPGQQIDDVWIWDVRDLY